MAQEQGRVTSAGPSGFERTGWVPDTYHLMIAGARRFGLVVIVEDEWLIRMSAVSALSEAGFSVFEAECTDQAIAHLRDRRIHALFTDIHVPGPMDGLALAHFSRRSWPWLGILIVSGRARPQPHELPERSKFLPKPYDLDHVVAHLSEIIAM